MASWAEALDPKYRYIFIRGGRSSGKSHEVGAYLCERSFTEKNLKIVGLREVQKSIRRSSKQLIDEKLESFGVSKYYKSIETEIRKTIEGDAGLFTFQGMNDLTADNVKSLEGYKISWFEEAQNASFKTLKTLRPTIRTEGSQLIFTWNPFLPSDPIEEFCESVKYEKDVLVLHVNYTDNPFLSDSILREIELDKKHNPESFEHIWLGQYDDSFQGHYYAKLIQRMETEERITDVQYREGVDTITAWDLGMRDSTAIWVAQRVGFQWRIVDYYENALEDLEHYSTWLKDRGYSRAMVYLPHDGGHNRIGMAGSVQAQLRDYGFNSVYVLPNNSVDGGISQAKTLLKECYIDQTKCKEGVAALKHYHAVYDEVKKIYKPLHDWSSHGADAFRYLAAAIALEDARIEPPAEEDDYIEPSTSWMG